MRGRKINGEMGAQKKVGKVGKWMEEGKVIER